MRCQKLTLAAILLAPVLAAGAVTKEFQIRIPMRDGVRLAANVFREEVCDTQFRQ